MDSYTRRLDLQVQREVPGGGRARKDAEEGGLSSFKRRRSPARALGSVGRPLSRAPVMHPLSRHRRRRRSRSGSAGGITGCGDSGGTRVSGTGWRRCDAQAQAQAQAQVQALTSALIFDPCSSSGRMGTGRGGWGALGKAVAVDGRGPGALLVCYIAARPKKGVPGPSAPRARARAREPGAGAGTKDQRRRALKHSWRCA